MKMKILKLLAVCVLCILIITGLVFFVQWVF